MSLSLFCSANTAVGWGFEGECECEHEGEDESEQRSGVHAPSHSRARPAMDYGKHKDKVSTAQ